ncbi:MAG: SDR family NAD(P)-dependent oxidoreductase [Candidatus Omnitrophica bacterium]|nr:SDR family NAD(P)-dependent oxidoreductase [Candidatus Omnitrophota bacterium]MCB9720443.1 SDR family NAD(P)-dependent oxidoreductase [Candidatus Omnitrophota bacterium]
MIGSTLFITGISSGLGEDIMRLAVRDGMRVTGVLRSSKERDRLAEEFGDKIEIIKTDLSDRDRVLELCANLRERRFDYICLNAASGLTGRFHELDEESVDELIDANLWANMRLVRALLPRALEIRSKIVLVSSLISELTRDDCTTYAVTKAGLSKFYRCLHKEYPQLPLVCAEIGPVDTPIHKKSGGADTPKNPFIYKNCHTIARRIYKAMLQDEGLKTLSWDWALLRMFARLTG